MGRLLLLNLSVLATAVGALVLTLVLLHALERAVGRFVAHRLGWRAVLVTGWIGVPIHELSHLLVAVIFRHRIVGYSLFDPDPSTGTLGYVRHAHTRPTPWQMAGYFFVGLAPLLGGAAVLGLILAWMVPAPRLFELARAAIALPAADAAALFDPAALFALGRRLCGLARTLVAEIWRHKTLWLPLQLYLCVAVAAHLAPSRRDLSGGLRGGLVLFLALLAGAAVATATRTSLAPVLAVVPAFAAILTLTLAFQVLFAVAAAAFAAAFGRR